MLIRTLFINTGKPIENTLFNISFDNEKSLNLIERKHAIIPGKLGFIA